MSFYGRGFGRTYSAPIREIKTLQTLPTWAKEGPKIYSEHPMPADCQPKFKPNQEINSKVSFWMRGDSASLKCDAIVNAANSALAPGGGICGVIHGAAGPELAEECYQIGGCPTGKAVVTKGYHLPAKHVIHAVGPIGENPAALESVYNETLNKIDGTEIRSVGLCCISTGIYGYPIRPATHIALRVTREWLEKPENAKKCDRIIFVVFEPRDVKVYYELVHTYFPLGDIKVEDAKEAISYPNIKDSAEPQNTDITVIDSQKETPVQEQPKPSDAEEKEQPKAEE